MNINDDEHLEQRLRESRDLLEGVIGSAMDAIIAVDDAQRIVLFNAAAEKIFACRADEAVGSPVERFMPERFRAGHSARVRRFGESGVTNRTLSGLGALWGLRATGEEFPIEASISKVESGGRKYFSAVIRDITERKMAEEALRSSEERLRLAHQAARIGTFERDVRTERMTWAEGLEPLYGLSPGSLDGKTLAFFYDLVHPADRERAAHLIRQALKTGQPTEGEWRAIWPDGSVHWIVSRWQVLMDDTGEPSRIVGINMDVTERKQAEDALRASEERFRLAARASRMYSFDWDVTTDVVLRSSEHVDIFGLTEPLRSTHAQFMEKIYPADRPTFITTIAGLTPEKPTADITYRIQNSEGTLLWLKSSGRGFFNAEGKLLRVIGMVADITDLKQAEEAVSAMTRKLIEAQEQERARIGRELHDDIGQRLAVLAVELEQLKENPSEVSIRVQELWKQVTDISNDVQALSHDLHSSKLEYLGVVAGMRSWCKEFGERHGMQIDCRHDVGSSLPPDIGLCLFRVLQEALHNAANHSGVKRIEVQLREDSGEIHLIVRDSGRGFEIEAARHGRGLGLTSMQERVRLVKGTIEIQSKPMGGTTIHVRVPLDSGHNVQRAAG